MEYVVTTDNSIASPSIIHALETIKSVVKVLVMPTATPKTKPAIIATGEAQTVIPTVKTKKRLTEAEKDRLFEESVGIWKDSPVGDEVLEAIRIGREPADYERKLAYIDD